jgi:hypothetical protein
MCSRTNDLKAVKRQVIALKKIYVGLSDTCADRYHEDQSNKYSLGKAQAYRQASEAFDDLRVLINNLIEGEAE